MRKIAGFAIILFWLGLGSVIFYTDAATSVASTDQNVDLHEPSFAERAQISGRFRLMSCSADTCTKYEADEVEVSAIDQREVFLRNGNVTIISRNHKNLVQTYFEKRAINLGDTN